MYNHFEDVHSHIQYSLPETEIEDCQNFLKKVKHNTIEIFYFSYTSVLLLYSLFSPQQPCASTSPLSYISHYSASSASYPPYTPHTISCIIISFLRFFFLDPVDLLLRAGRKIKLHQLDEVRLLAAPAGHHVLQVECPAQWEQVLVTSTYD